MQILPRTALLDGSGAFLCSIVPGGIAAGRLPSCPDILVGMRTHPSPVRLSNKTQKARETVLFR
jgi:hypothetical protein